MFFKHQYFTFKKCYSYCCFLLNVGSSVRIDTTLLGFYQSKWQRGNRSYIFKGHGKSCIFKENQCQSINIEIFILLF